MFAAIKRYIESVRTKHRQAEILRGLIFGRAVIAGMGYDLALEMWASHKDLDYNPFDKGFEIALAQCFAMSEDATVQMYDSTTKEVLAVCDSYGVWHVKEES